MFPVCSLQQVVEAMKKETVFQFGMAGERMDYRERHLAAQSADLMFRPTTHIEDKKVISAIKLQMQPLPYAPSNPKILKP
jgi:hypothetical protein